MSDSVPTAAAADVWDWDSAGPTAPNPARMYDYYLGGKDNFRVDRDAAEKAVAANPVIPVLARANRAFLVDAVRQMAAAGITQYLDIGSGLPTSPNVHEVACATVPDARVVYVDVDPVVVSHSRVKRGRSGTATVRADLRSPTAVLAAPEVGKLIDFSQPCGLLMMSVLHFISGDITPLVAEYTRRLAPGSYLALAAEPGWPFGRHQSAPARAPWRQHLATTSDPSVTLIIRVISSTHCHCLQREAAALRAENFQLPITFDHLYSPSYQF